MEEQDIKEAKRARNFIWMAACDYDIEPLFLAFAPDGTADIYLNLIIGFEYKWYEHDKIDALFNQLTGKNAMLYEGRCTFHIQILQDRAKRARSSVSAHHRDRTGTHTDQRINAKQMGCSDCKQIL